MSKRFMRLPLRFKSQLDLQITTTIMKVRDEHSKTSSWFTNTKVYSLQHLSVVVGKRETGYENWVGCVSVTKRMKISWREREGRHRPWIIFHVSLVIQSVLVLLFRLHNFAFGVKPIFWAHPPNVCRNFRLTSHVRSWYTPVVFTMSRPTAN